MCGELRDLAGLDSGYHGSSPRVRGTRLRSLHRDDGRRFIPACAGNSCRQGRPCPGGTVYPRVCGELRLYWLVVSQFDGSSPRVRGTRLGNLGESRNSRFIPACAGNSASPTALRRGDTGSSPRVRGTRALALFVAAGHRFIPACAGNSSTIATSRRWTAVHPRVCGELARVRNALARLLGSSPRVRGTHRLRARQERRGRFIPACAGNSSMANCQPCDSSVHPRVCGELGLLGSGEQRSVGSSPRVRGTRRRPRRWRLGGRFIPACAGNSVSNTQYQPDSIGSSPRVRGTLADADAEIESRRFIPACAGNSAAPPTPTPARPVHPRVCGELVRPTLPLRPPSGSSPRVRGTPGGPQHADRARQVHPRVCGELWIAGIEAEVQRGSSPRVRGTHPPCPPCRLCRRFIPACAGNSAQTAAAFFARSVHPRVCGELCLLSATGQSGDGSSPRVRGTLGRRDASLLEGRFIPACAGNSSSRRWLRLRTTVHPRVCGELPGSGVQTAAYSGSSPRVRGTREDDCIMFSPGCGSSPRVRGTRRCRRPQAAWPGFIPACAGNSSPERSPWASPTVHPRVCGELQSPANVPR